MLILEPKSTAGKISDSSTILLGSECVDLKQPGAVSLDGTMSSRLRRSSAPAVNIVNSTAYVLVLELSQNERRRHDADSQEVLYI